jgi:hypothetical protein
MTAAFSMVEYAQDGNVWTGRSVHISDPADREKKGRAFPPEAAVNASISRKLAF